MRKELSSNRPCVLHMAFGHPTPLPISNVGTFWAKGISQYVPWGHCSCPSACVCFLLSRLVRRQLRSGTAAAVGWWGVAGAAAASGERVPGRGAATGPAHHPPSACSRHTTTTTTSGTRCCQHSTTCPMQQVRVGRGWAGGQLYPPLGRGTLTLSPRHPALSTSS